MLSKEANGLTQTQLNDKATQYFDANITNTEAKNIAVTPVFTHSAGRKLRAQRFGERDQSTCAS